MSDTTKPTKEEITKIRSRLIFLKDKTSFLFIPFALAYIAAYILLVMFDQYEYVVTIVALALLSGMTSIDRLYDLRDAYKIINKEDKGVKDV